MVSSWGVPGSHGWTVHAVILIALATTSACSHEWDELRHQADAGAAGATGGDGGSGGTGGDAGQGGANPSHWSVQLGDSTDQFANDVALDGQGNAIVIGSFSGTIALADCDPLVTDPNKKSIFVTKLDPNGGCQWALQLGDSDADQHGRSVAVDSGGNIVIGGAFVGTMSFDQETVATSTQGSMDIFVAKLDAAGKHLWHQQFGDEQDQCSLLLGCHVAVAVDADDDVLVAGSYRNRIDFGGGMQQAAGADLYVTKRAGGTGAYLWAVRPSADGDQVATAVGADSANNVVIAGSFRGTTSFGCSGEGWLATQTDDGFVVGYDAEGTCQYRRWLQDLSAGQRPRVLAIDGQDRVWVAGDFDGHFQVGAADLTSQGEDVFLLRLTAAPEGSVDWGRAFGDTQTQHALGVAAHGADTVALTGSFWSATDFGCASALSSLGLDDIYVTELDGSGECRQAERFGDTSGKQVGRAIATDGSTHVVVGDFEGTVDFGAGPLTSQGGRDVFVAKLPTASD